MVNLQNPLVPLSDHLHLWVFVAFPFSSWYNTVDTFKTRLKYTFSSSLPPPSSRKHHESSTSLSSAAGIHLRPKYPTADLNSSSYSTGTVSGALVGQDSEPVVQKAPASVDDGRRCA